MKLEVINRKLTDRLEIHLVEQYWYRTKPIAFINLHISLGELSNVKLFEEGTHFLSQKGIELLHYHNTKI